LFFFAVIATAVGPLTHDARMAHWMLIAIGVLGTVSAAKYALLRRSFHRDFAVRAAELRQQGDPSGLAVGEYRQFIVTGGALIEGPAFLADVTYLLTAHWLALGAVALAMPCWPRTFPRRRPYVVCKKMRPDRSLFVLRLRSWGPSMVTPRAKNAGIRRGRREVVVQIWLDGASLLNPKTAPPTECYKLPKVVLVNRILT